MLTTRKIGSYHFGFYNHLSKAQLRALSAHFDSTCPSDSSVLGGRTAVTRIQLEGVGAVVLKHYRRGGWLGRIVKQHYLGFGQNRARREFELLHLAAASGVNVPHAVAYAYCGRLFYRAWLITGEISQPISLIQLSQKDSVTTAEVMKWVGHQISQLIQNRIWHVDLHPGNVIVDQAGKVFLLDFDRGKIYSGYKHKLKKRYLARWQRAVAKHGLPIFLTEFLQDSLQSTTPGHPRRTTASS